LFAVPAWVLHLFEVFLGGHDVLNCTML
jgi:hypothetical protein